MRSSDDSGTGSLRTTRNDAGGAEVAARHVAATSSRSGPPKWPVAYRRVGMVHAMTVLLGGDASPIGWSIQFLEAPVARVLDVAVEIHRENNKVRVSRPREYPGVLHKLLPFESPWTRELLMSCGDWTAYLNNWVNGGDSSAIGPAIARTLGVRCVVASHSPEHGPGHAGTQLSLMGPEGMPPLMYQRTIGAVATDGRWAWYSSGDLLPFEDAERYTARLVKNRFDREMLLTYLEALEIPARDDNAYGPGVIVQQRVTWKRRTESLDEHRRYLELD